MASVKQLASKIKAAADAYYNTGNPVMSDADFDAPQVVKVVRDERGDALYFSRAPIPYRPGDTAAAYSRSEMMRFCSIVSPLSALRTRVSYMEAWKRRIRNRACL